jgi:hypothetical protein
MMNSDQWHFPSDETFAFADFVTGQGDFSRVGGFVISLSAGLTKLF